jgi:L-2-hydroxyglutarate oxidase LhgO
MTSSRASLSAPARETAAAASARGLAPRVFRLARQLTPPGHEGIVDFVVTPDSRFPQIIHLVGIESPGLTAAASLARTVAALVLERLN